MKKVKGSVVKIDKNPNQITRIVLDYAGRVRYVVFRGEPPKGVEIGKSYQFVVDNSRLRLVECRVLDEYGNISKRMFPSRSFRLFKNI